MIPLNVSTAQPSQMIIMSQGEAMRWCFDKVCQQADQHEGTLIVMLCAVLVIQAALMIWQSRKIKKLRQEVQHK